MDERKAIGIAIKSVMAWAVLSATLLIGIEAYSYTIERDTPRCTRCLAIQDIDFSAEQ